MVVDDNQIGLQQNLSMEWYGFEDKWKLEKIILSFSRLNWSDLTENHLRI